MFVFFAKAHIEDVEANQREAMKHRDLQMEMCFPPRSESILDAKGPRVLIRLEEQASAAIRNLLESIFGVHLVWSLEEPIQKKGMNSRCLLPDLKGFRLQSAE